jgi:hypothetical protein
MADLFCAGFWSRERESGMADNEPCGSLRCARYEMTQLEFRRLRGELWDQSFISSLGKTASKLYREIYRKKPKLKYSRSAKRDPVHKYPCGILEQAYRHLKDQGLPLVKPDSALARQIERQADEHLRRDEPPPEWTTSANTLRNPAESLRKIIARKMLSK